MRDADLKNFIMTHRHTEAKIIFSIKRGTLTKPMKLTEPHYMFCGTLGFRGTPVEEHWSRLIYCICITFYVSHHISDTSDYLLNLSF